VSDLGKLIYIVDDTMSILSIAASVVEDDYRVLTMVSAKKMFELIAKKRPDMILLDVEMPDMDGYEATRRLRDNPDWTDIPVIFLTGYIDDVVTQRASDLGVLDVIDKTQIGSTLLSRVGERLREQEVAEE